MAITVNGTPGSTINSTAGTSNTVTIPASMTTSHYLLYGVGINADKTASFSAPAGWDVIKSPVANGSNCTGALYGKQWSSGMSNPSSSWTGSSKNAGFIVPLLGVDMSNPSDVAASSATGNSGSPASPTITAATMGAFRVHMTVRAGTGTSAPDFRMIEAIDITTSATSPAAVTFDYEAEMASDAAGTRTSTVTSAQWLAISAFIRPATPTTFGLLRSASLDVVAAGSGNISLASGDVANSPTGTLIVVAGHVWHPNATISNMTYNSGGNVLTKVGRASNTSSYDAEVWYYENNTVTGAITIAVTHSASADANYTAMEFKGAATSGALDTFNTATGNSTSAANTMTPASGQVLLIQDVGSDTTLTVDANYVQRWNRVPAANRASGASATREMAGGSSTTATMTMASVQWAAILASFKPPAAGGGTVSHRLALLGVGG